MRYFQLLSLVLALLVTSRFADAEPTTYYLSFTSQVTNGGATGGGGLFNAKLYEVDTDGLQTSGLNSDFLKNLQTQCIDYWNYLAYDSPFKVVMTSVNDTSGIAAYTRFGGIYNNKDGTAPGGQATDFANAYTVCPTTTTCHAANAADRYKMVAYLASIYKTYVGQSQTTRDAIQTAMWKLTQPLTYSSGGFLGGSGITSTQYWLNQAIASGLKQTDAFYSRWMIVTEFPLNNLGPVNGQNQKWQEQIVEITPEPSFFAMMGLGLAGLLYIHRKRQQTLTA